MTEHSGDPRKGLQTKPEAMGGDATDPADVRAWQAVKALQSVGGLQKRVIAWFVALVVAVNLFSGWLQEVLSPFGETIVAVLRRWIGFPVIPPGSVGKSAWEALALGAFIAVGFTAAVWWLRRKAFRGPPSLRPTVDRAQPGAPVALVLFLSTPNLVGGFKQELEKAFGKMPKADEEVSNPWKAAREFGMPPPDAKPYEKEQGELFALTRLVALIGARLKVSRGNLHRPFGLASTDFADLVGDERLKFERALNNAFATCNWRMTIDSIRPYVEPNRNLRDIVIVPSSDGKRFVGYNERGGEAFRPLPGSLHAGEIAKKFIGAVLSANGVPVGEGSPGGVRIRLVGELMVPAAPNRARRALAPSVSYSNLEEINRVLYDVTVVLRNELRCGEQDIIVDITSGTVVATAAAVAYSTLVQNRRFQNVDTNTYDVATYDVTHQFDLGE